MSNESGPVGGLTISQDEGEVAVFVSEWWTSAKNGSSLSVKVPGRKRYEVDMNHDEARKLATVLLKSTLPAEMPHNGYGKALLAAVRSVINDVFSEFEHEGFYDDTEPAERDPWVIPGDHETTVTEGKFAAFSDELAILADLPADMPWTEARQILAERIKKS